MSLLNDLERKENPIKKYISWVKPTKEALKKEWCYWDKELKQNVVVERPIYFMPIDAPFAQCTGFNEEKRAGWFSTQVSVYETNKKMMTLFLGGEKFKTGYWQDLKNETGVKFAQVINAVMITPKGGADPEFELVAFVFTGSSFSGGKKSELQERRKLFKTPSHQISGWANLDVHYRDRKIITICQDTLSFVNATATNALKNNGVDKEVTYEVPLFEKSKSAKSKEFILKFKNLLDEYEEFKKFKEKDIEVNENSDFLGEIANTPDIDQNIPLPPESQAPPENDSDDLPF